MRLKYPTPNKIIETNKFVLNRIVVKKADKPQVLSYSKIEDSLRLCKSTKGDAYDKASCLLVSLTKNHVFASGNRRTALVITKTFLSENKLPHSFKNNGDEAEVLRDIRYGRYDHDEIKKWIKTGKRIYSFK